MYVYVAVLGKSLVLEFRLESPRESLSYVLVKCVCSRSCIFIITGYHLFT